MVTKNKIASQNFERLYFVLNTEFLNLIRFENNTFALEQNEVRKAA